MKAIILGALAAGAVAAGVCAAGVAHAVPSDDETYGRLVADARAQGIPGGTTQMGTLAEATCSVAAGATSQSDADGTLRDLAPPAWSLLQSWTKEQAHAFGALVIADGYCGSMVGGAR
jgi:hypothetical protein